MSQSVLAYWVASKFGAHLTQSAIHLILKKRTDLESIKDTELSTKLPRVAQNPKLEDALSTWVVQCQTRNVALTGEIIKVRAKVFFERLGLPEGTIKYFSGWLQHF